MEQRPFTFRIIKEEVFWAKDENEAREKLDEFIEDEFNSEYDYVDLVEEKETNSKLELSTEGAKFFSQFHDFFTENFHIKKDEMDKILKWYANWNNERPENGYLGEDEDSENDMQKLEKIYQYERNRSQREV